MSWTISYFSEIINLNNCDSAWFFFATQQWEKYETSINFVLLEEQVEHKKGILEKVRLWDEGVVGIKAKPIG